MAVKVTNLVANLRPRILQNQAIHITRSLNGSGNISVSVGMEVAPQDLIGKLNQISGYTSIKLAQKLGVSPKEALKYLQKPLSSTIFKGELLALKKGLLGEKKIFSPTDGVMEKYDDQSGELRLRFLIKQSPVPAGVFGIVDQIDRAKGEVLIKTSATVIYGPIGFGLQRSGILKILGDPTSPIRASQITPDLSRHILAAGALVFKDALIKATVLGVLGFISGGINTADYESMVGRIDLNQWMENDVGLTILATEGFGPLPLGADVLGLLKNYDGKFIFLDGNSHRIVLPNFNADVVAALRKVSLPLPQVGQNLPEVSISEIEIGRKVRLIFAPFMGVQGVISAVDNTPSLLESGISTYMVTIETEHKKIKVPISNIELIT